MSTISLPSSQGTTRPAEEEPEGAPSSKSPKLTNSAAQQQEDATQASSISATTTHVREGVTYRSVGVSARNSVEPEEGDAEMKEPEKELKDPWKTLPRDVVEKVLEWTLEVQTRKAENSYAEEDIRKTGWSKDKDTTVGANLAKARYAALIPLKSVCRLWYKIVTPWFWQHLDFRHCTMHSYGAQHRLENILSTTSTIFYSDSRAPDPVVNPPKAPPAEAVEPVVVDDPPPLTLPPQAQVPLGHFVHKYTVGTCDSCLTYFLGQLPHLPRLREIVLASSKHLKTNQLASIVLHTAGPSLRSVDHAYLGTNEDLSLRCEQILSLVNHAPNLEKLGVMGEGFNLTEAYAKRLSFVLTLNSCLKHRQTEALGVGLCHLYLGPGCSIPVSFLRGLKDCAPRLTTLHIKTGVKILADSSPMGQQPFDLHGFAASWGGQLTELTLVGVEGFSTRGYLDDVLKLCPNLVSLYLRSDHITFAFFKSIQDLVFKPDPDHPPANGIVPSFPSSQKLRHALSVLAIAVRLPPGETSAVKGSISSLTIFPSGFLPFANACLRIEARTRLSWPTEMGGQRDVLERAALMCKTDKEKEKGATLGKAQARWNGVSTLVGAQEQVSDEVIAIDDGDSSDDEV
ncbi:hypothetical protein BCR35DRAFT_304937 [Leucosporidium creatinivorum]|uniref:F-box domain-containing protein n=1 Tax=Leucosporidium creatinivorum TaxID=106004 RepID=A0A1Y2F5G9_9BASI|nr:hypothetical protein BCR35DRAFT_304937 [Leucosporidium creatinivorum]